MARRNVQSRSRCVGRDSPPSTQCSDCGGAVLLFLSAKTTAKNEKIKVRFLGKDGGDAVRTHGHTDTRTRKQTEWLKVLAKNN